METVKRTDMRALGDRISGGLAAGSWDVPTLILTGEMMQSPKHAQQSLCRACSWRGGGMSDA